MRFAKTLLVLLISITLLTSGVLSYAFPSHPPLSSLADKVNIPNFTDKEFYDAKVRIDIATASWCHFCAQLKQELPAALYSAFNKKDVAIRIWDVDKPGVKTFFEQFQNQLNLPQEFRASVPFTVISYNNKIIGYLGYAQNIRDQMIADIKAILQNQPLPYGGNIKDLIKSREQQQKQQKQSQQQNQNEFTGGLIGFTQCTVQWEKVLLIIVSSSIILSLFTFILLVVNIRKQNKLIQQLILRFDIEQKVKKLS